MGLLAPAALLFAGLFVPVIVMYFFRQRRETVVLPTIALWVRYVQEQSHAARFTRLRSSLLFWLQLVLMAALILSLARPFRRGGHAPGQITVMVLDASASMQTRENGDTRFDRAKAEIADAAGALGGGDRMMLVAAGPRPWVVQGLTDDASAFARALRGLRCTDGAGDLATALRVAAQAAGPGTPPAVHVWTDGAGRALEGVEDLRVPVQWHGVGSAEENVAATALAVRRRPDSPMDLEVFASITNLGTQVREVAVSLTLDGALLSYGRRRLGAGETALLTEPLLAGRAGVIQLRVEPADALPVDDRATLVLSPRHAAQVLLVTRGSTLLERVLRLLPGVELTVAAPGAVRVAQTSADLIVFDRWVPPQWPPVPALVVSPPSGPAFARAHLVRAPAVVAWRRDHPLLRHLTFADVHVAEGLVQAPGTGITSLVSAAEGGLIWTQRAGGTQQMVIGFPLTASDWILRPSFPLFLANVIESVRDEGGGAGVAAHVGDSLHARVPPGVATATVQYPDGRNAPVELRARVATVDDTWQAGLYHFRGNGWAEIRAVNLLDADESHIQPQPLPEVSTEQARRAGIGVTREYWPWLLGLALLVSTVEWAVFHRRTT